MEIISIFLYICAALAVVGAAEEDTTAYSGGVVDLVSVPDKIYFGHQFAVKYEVASRAREIPNNTECALSLYRVVNGKISWDTRLVKDAVDDQTAIIYWSHPQFEAKHRISMRAPRNSESRGWHVPSKWINWDVLYGLPLRAAYDDAKFTFIISCQGKSTVTDKWTSWSSHARFRDPVDKDSVFSLFAEETAGITSNRKAGDVPICSQLQIERHCKNTHKYAKGKCEWKRGKCTDKNTGWWREEVAAATVLADGESGPASLPTWALATIVALGAAVCVLLVLSLVFAVLWRRSAKNSDALAGPSARTSERAVLPARRRMTTHAKAGFSRRGTSNNVYATRLSRMSRY